MNNVKKIIASIERNHALMDAQIEKLAGLSPELNMPILSGTGNSADVSGLLEATLLGQMQGAANALKALAEVQADFATMARENQRSLTTGGGSAEVIDVEYTEVETKEDK